MQATKNKKNRLAHGEQTFYEVGKDFSVNDLFAFKDETFKYLSDVSTWPYVFRYLHIVNRR